ncbi:MAG: ABC transporter ATP-binding protein [Candidatus Latescibacteria bacterium]|nr:ABC transporter ATP-binding protein [Candidatus Latescibacterota bacterium]
MQGFIKSLIKSFKRGSTLRRLAAYLLPYRMPMIGVIAVIVAQSVVKLLPPLLMKYIIDDILIPRSNAGLLVWCVLGLLGVNILNWFFNILNEWGTAWLGHRATTDIQADLYQHLQMLPLRTYDKQKVGALISRITDDAGRLQILFSGSGPYFLVNAVMLAGMLAILLSMSWELTLYAMLPAPLIILATRVFQYRDLLRRLSINNARFNAHVSETLAGLRLVKTCAQEAREAERFDGINNEVRQSHTAFGRILGHYFQSSQYMLGLGIFLVWYAGGRAVLDPADGMTLGGLLAFLSYIAMLYQPLNWFIIFHGQIIGGMMSVERVFELMDEAPEPFYHPDAVPMPQMKGHVAFHHVSFGYDRSTPVLEDITLDVAPGEMIGLVGRSGVGKTTMINLICRFYEVERGALKIDGIDIRDIRLQDLRRHIGIAPQASFLFNGTIADNIRFGKPEASMEEVIQAAVAAHAHDFIVARKDGYDTLIGEQGSRLSGGERQRITIARAILSDPTILILDEATSSVDVESEQHIQEAIARLIQGRTTFAIAHRLSTLRRADRIVVLDDNRIAEIGTHEALMARQGLFYQMVRAQQETSAIVAVHGGKDDPEREKEHTYDR